MDELPKCQSLALKDQQYIPYLLKAARISMPGIQKRETAYPVLPLCYPLQLTVFTFKL